MQFAIHESNLDRLQKKVTRIQNKCKKYGCDFLYREVGEEFRTLDEGTSKERVERYVLVEAEGKAVVNGWEFAATLEHTDTGNIIRQFLEGVEIPDRYRTCDAFCEHCKIRRPRKDTYIVYNKETNEFKQVGSSCLCDFTGGLSAEAVASYISMFDEMIKGESPEAGYSIHPFYELDKVLAYATVYVSDLGYVSSQSWSGSTRDTVLEAIRYDQGKANKVERESVEEYRNKFHPNYTSEEVINRVSEIREFIKAAEADSSYINNLKVIESSGHVDARNLGYAVSMVSCYNRHVEKVERQRVREAAQKVEAEVSNFLGSEGDRIVVVDPAVTPITSWDTMYGTTIRYKIVDTKGNVCMWDCSSYVEADLRIKSIKGTVKKLDTYNGVKQTWLTRCRVEYYPKAKEDHETVIETESEKAFNEFYEMLTA